MNAAKNKLKLDFMDFCNDPLVREDFACLVNYTGSGCNLPTFCLPEVASWLRTGLNRIAGEQPSGLLVVYCTSLAILSGMNLDSETVRGKVLALNGFVQGAAWAAGWDDEEEGAEPGIVQNKVID